jgi:hypothetical protein
MFYWGGGWTKNMLMNLFAVSQLWLWKVVTTCSLAYLFTLKMEAICSTEASGCLRATRRYNTDRFKVYHWPLHNIHSDWLRAGRPRGRSSSPGRSKKFYSSMLSGPVLGPTDPPIQRATGALSPDVKRPRRDADHSLPASAEVPLMLCILLCIDHT